MGTLSWIIFGLIAGILAKWIMPGKDGGGFIVTIILGIATYQVISVLEDKFLYWHESKN